MNKVRVIFQNKDFLAVDKDCGISVHNKEDPQNLLALLEDQLNLPDILPVHRLDKETSGIQILALNSAAAKKLAGEFQNRSVKKIYVGVLRGQLKTPEGVWTRPLTDKAEGRKNPEGTSRDRVPCETKFRVLKDTRYFSLCEFDLLTGRQHQIRKHTALINHPLVGDSRYGDPKYNAKMAGLYKSDRMYLHCTRVEIFGQIIESPVPVNFEVLLDGVL
jgi:tRNA pseudouridine65 synthase